MIYVPQHTERILINHSSGMDSTLLIYLLLTELKNQSLLDKVKIFINTGFDPIADPYAPEILIIRLSIEMEKTLKFLTFKISLKNLK